MERLSSLALSARDVEIDFLGVVKVTFYIEHSIIPLVPANGNVTVMQRLSRNGECRKWHVKSLMNKKLSILQK